MVAAVGGDGSSFFWYSGTGFRFPEGRKKGRWSFRLSSRNFICLQGGRDIRGGHERDCNTDRAKIRQDEEEENSVRNL